MTTTPVLPDLQVKKSKKTPEEKIIISACTNVDNSKSKYKINWSSTESTGNEDLLKYLKSPQNIGDKFCFFSPWKATEIIIEDSCLIANSQMAKSSGSGNSNNSFELKNSTSVNAGYKNSSTENEGDRLDDGHREKLANTHEYNEKVCVSNPAYNSSVVRTDDIYVQDNINSTGAETKDLFQYKLSNSKTAKETNDALSLSPCSLPCISPNLHDDAESFVFDHATFKNDNDIFLKPANKTKIVESTAHPKQNVEN